MSRATFNDSINLKRFSLSKLQLTEKQNISEGKMLLFPTKNGECDISYFATCSNNEKKELIVTHFRNHRCQIHISLPLTLPDTPIKYRIGFVITVTFSFIPKKTAFELTRYYVLYYVGRNIDETPQIS